MIDIRKSLRGKYQEEEINVMPLVDMVFLLLIFFMVTTSFVKEAGIDVHRPTAATAQLKDKGNILLGVSADGRIFFEKKAIDLRSVRAHIERSLAESPEGAVVIVADQKSDTGVIVRVMDQCRLAGARRVSIAATRPGAKG
ncbi:biopolymer transporter ExbD [Desulfosarcina ovata subsp. sediminis]|uniref:Biopolymer transporter ExbD n=1 Tax=Desulfosarcina ovata subsp. sediminis TaxID=885957 RepID=A0A5K7ZYX3_9BACT|nr:biopolymer transporter ExbD [Desulfosarcina ovata]BBO85463.1 biopolymer transporter ExbD [Desulfosarcina ovata subsp. sediminis]